MAKIVLKRNSKYWSLHTHSKYSDNDALPSVAEIVAEAKRLGYRGLALTDHGNMAGSVELYRECVKAGIKPFPGSEFYLVTDRGDKKAKRYHVGLVAYTTEGYRNLIRISTRSHRQFHHKPLLDLGDLAELSEAGHTAGIALTTGCFFGLVQQTLIQHGYQEAKRVVAMYASWFDTYVEIQQHKIDHGEGVLSEEEITEALLKMAGELELPVVITQDSHYTVAADKPVHDALKRLVAFGPEPDDAVFPGSGFHMVGDDWMIEHHGPEVYEAGLAGLERLLDLWDLHIAEIDDYHYSVPDVGELNRVKRRVVRRAAELGLASKKRYYDQIMLEFEIIDHARMWGYLGLVAQVCDHMREAKMFFQIRGSAGGSLVCYLLGIAEHDPIKWKLRMDRFLSKDRTKPPDIDIDVESNRRQELIDWIGQTYAVAQIGTWRVYSISGEGEDGKGSLRVRYLSRQRAMGKDPDWDKVSAADRAMMTELSGRELYSGAGTHPAGLLVTNTRSELEEQVPLMWNANSKLLVTQYDGKVVESLGLVKLDVLGVRNLDILRLCLLNMGRDPADGLGFIPLTDRETFSALSKGQVAGVFQLEGFTSSREVRVLKPNKIGDVIAAMALFRPGVMVSGGMKTFMDRRFKNEPVPEMHPILHRATRETYGVLLYQDSVIEILREIGMEAEDLTAMLKAIKASNKNVTEARKVMEHYKPAVYDMCERAGIDRFQTEWLWEGIEGFSDYSFNRAHATIYGITAYRCAYLSQHHPVEFHAAMLAATAGFDKEKPYIIATRARGIRLLKPDVSYSGSSYSVDPKGRGIRRGLTSIKGIGPAIGQEIESKQPFTSMEDFASRVTPRIVSGVADYLNDKSFATGRLNTLYEAGALNSLLDKPVL